jgi:glycosyl-4,4'-diaponeurosporenoate acyltransferase
MRVHTPIGRLPATAVVAANMAFWPAWTALVGFAAARTGDQRFDHDDGITRLRPVERDGHWYREQWRIESWKQRLPERGAAFGGFAKRSVAFGSDDVLRQFVVETRRAEHAHWGMTAGMLLTVLWNPWWALPVNAAVALGSNVPCIAVQRYNRARLLRVLSRSSRLPVASALSSE